MDFSNRPLGNNPPKDKRHVELFPLTAALPVTVDSVEKTLRVPALVTYYDQGVEGECVGFGLSWAKSVQELAQYKKRIRYDARWLYRLAQQTDEFPGEDYSGTTVRAGCEILRTVGHRRVVGVTKPKTDPPSTLHGIASYRWAITLDGIRTAIADGRPCVLGCDWYTNFDKPVKQPDGSQWIGKGDLGSVRGGHAICVVGASDTREAILLRNTWGTDYPAVWLPYETARLLLAGWGEAAILFDHEEN